MNSLSSRGIQVNGHAETLIEDVIFDDQASRPGMVTERTVAELDSQWGDAYSYLGGCTATKLVAVPGGYCPLFAHGYDVSLTIIRRRGSDGRRTPPATASSACRGWAAHS